MREALRAVPPLYWVAALIMALTLVAGDWRGVVIAVFCLLVGTAQLVRDQRDQPDQGP